MGALHRVSSGLSRTSRPAGSVCLRTRRLCHRHRHQRGWDLRPDSKRSRNRHRFRIPGHRLRVRSYQHQWSDLHCLHCPVILNTGAAGYGSQNNTLTANTYADGYINVSFGNCGKQDPSSDENGDTYYTGDTPSCLADQKAAARYVQYNILLGNLPGSSNYLISTGDSGGGAHAVMFAATSNNPNFYDYQIEAGAVGGITPKTEVTPARRTMYSAPVSRMLGTGPLQAHGSAARTLPGLLRAASWDRQHRILKTASECTIAGVHATLYSILSDDLGVAGNTVNRWYHLSAAVH